jgi:hypothetical protein
MEGRRPTTAQRRLVGLIVALGLARVAFDVIARHHLRQTAALFIGLPAILAIAVALSPRAQTATGTILKGVTIALLLASTVLGEGLVCIVFAAPLFYAVGVAVGMAIDYIERKRQDRASTGTYLLILLPFLTMSVEGVYERTALSRFETVTVERVVAAAAIDVEQTLTHAPAFDLPLPLALRPGFPAPVASSGTGLDVGARRAISFTAGRRPAGALVLEVAARHPRLVRFKAVSDDTPIAQWLDWHDAQVEWSDINRASTRVRWTVRYRRLLDPAWYFGPLERLVVRAAAGYLIDAAATPRVDAARTVAPR